MQSNYLAIANVITIIICVNTGHAQTLKTLTKSDGIDVFNSVSVTVSGEPREGEENGFLWAIDEAENTEYETLSVPKFDPALGTLQEVKVQIYGTTESTYNWETCVEEGGPCGGGGGYDAELIVAQASPEDTTSDFTDGGDPYDTGSEGDCWTGTLNDLDADRTRYYSDPGDLLLFTSEEDGEVIYYIDSKLTAIVSFYGNVPHVCSATLDGFAKVMVSITYFYETDE